MLDDIPPALVSDDTDDFPHLAASSDTAFFIYKDDKTMGFNKLFAAIAGKPVITHTIRAFERASSVTEIIVVACEERHDEIKKIAANESFEKVQSIIGGGEHRQDSVSAGLDHLNVDAKYVAVHDAARPLITAEQIERVFVQCHAHGAAALAEPIAL